MNGNSRGVHSGFMDCRQTVGITMKTRLCLLALIPFATMAGAERLRVDERHSSVEIDVRATVDSFTGRLEDYDPVILLDDAGEVTSATVSFHFEDVKTGKDERDRQMHEWQQTKRNPDGVFRLDSLTPSPEGDGFKARGRLEFHHTARELVFPVSITRDGPLIAIDGIAHVDTRDFDLPVIRKFLLLKVDPDVVVRFHLQGVRVDDAAGD